MAKKYMAYATGYGTIGKPNEDRAKVEAGLKNWVARNGGSYTDSEAGLYEQIAFAEQPVADIKLVDVK